MEELINDYERKIASVNELLENQTDIIAIRRLETKRGCFRAFVNDLKRATATPSPTSSEQNDVSPLVSNSLPVYDIDFGGHIMAGIQFDNGAPHVLGAVNGWGDGVDAHKIKVTKRQ